MAYVIPPRRAVPAPARTRGLRRAPATLLPRGRAPPPLSASPAPLQDLGQLDIQDDNQFPRFGTPATPSSAPPSPSLILSYATVVKKHAPNDLQPRGGIALANQAAPGQAFYYPSGWNEPEFEAGEEIAEAEIPDLTGRTNILKGGLYDNKNIM